MQSVTELRDVQHSMPAIHCCVGALGICPPSSLRSQRARISPPPQMKEDEEECCVCMQPTDTVIPNCRHVLCRSCAVQWFAKRIECPLCRVPPCSLPMLPDTRPCTPKEWSPFTFLATIALDEGKHAGLTLSTCEDGVRIEVCRKKDEGAKAGLKPGDVIFEMNGIRINKHDAALGIVRTATSMGFPIVCVAGRRQTRRYLSFWNLLVKAVML